MDKEEKEGKEPEVKVVPETKTIPDGAVYELRVEGDVKKGEKEEYICYLKEIDRNTFSFATRLIAGVNQDIVEAGSLIINSLWISGDEEMKSDKKEHEAIRIAAEVQACNIVETKQASLKKL